MMPPKFVFSSTYQRGDGAISTIQDILMKMGSMKCTNVPELRKVLDQLQMKLFGDLPGLIRNLSSSTFWNRKDQNLREIIHSYFDLNTLNPLEGISCVWNDVLMSSWSNPICRPFQFAVENSRLQEDSPSSKLALFYTKVTDSDTGFSYFMSLLDTSPSSSIVPLNIRDLQHKSLSKILRSMTTMSPDDSSSLGVVMRELSNVLTTYCGKSYLGSVSILLTSLALMKTNASLSSILQTVGVRLNMVNRENPAAGVFVFDPHKKEQVTVDSSKFILEYCAPVRDNRTPICITCMSCEVDHDSGCCPIFPIKSLFPENGPRNGVCAGLDQIFDELIRGIICLAPVPGALNALLDHAEQSLTPDQSLAPDQFNRHFIHRCTGAVAEMLLSTIQSYRTGFTAFKYVLTNFLREYNLTISINGKSLEPIRGHEPVSYDIVKMIFQKVKDLFDQNKRCDHRKVLKSLQASRKESDLLRKTLMDEADQLIADMSTALRSTVVDVSHMKDRIDKLAQAHIAAISRQRELAQSLDDASNEEEVKDPDEEEAKKTRCALIIAFLAGFDDGSNFKCPFPSDSDLALNYADIVEKFRRQKTDMAKDTLVSDLREELNDLTFTGSSVDLDDIQRQIAEVSDVESQLKAQIDELEAQILAARGK
jgi:hypothetical protein